MSRQKSGVSFGFENLLLARLAKGHTFPSPFLEFTFDDKAAQLFKIVHHSRPNTAPGSLARSVWPPPYAGLRASWNYVPLCGCWYIEPTSLRGVICILDLCYAEG
uniref:Uncharacterized protein n=1 Tax=Timema bartmani TaxID=61472 RepID=A0A7R9F8W8_9NEOP|nr:unnamed protein product [Timema bartmani]